MSRGLVNNMLTMNNLGDGSTLSLDFTTMGGVLDPRLTFSRASTATFVNSSGYVDHAGANLQLYSQDQSQTGTWVRQDLSGVDANVVATTDPNGGSNASKIKSAASLQAHLVYSTISTSISSGLAYTFSVYVKKAELKYFAIHLASTARYTVIFDLDTGVMTATNSTGTPLGTSYSSSNAGSGWWRLSATMITQSTTIYPHLCLSNSGTPSVNASGQPYYSGTLNDGVYTWGAQLNPGSTAQTYYPTTTAAYYAPRFDYSPTNIGEPRGLLIEGSSINKIYGSESLVSSGMPINWNYVDQVTRNSTLVTSPRGTADAVTVNETTANNIHRISQYSNSGFTAGSVCTFSCWAKVAKSATPRKLFVNLASLLNSQGLFDLTATGTSGTAQATGGTAVNKATSWIKYPGDWYRVTVTGNFVAESSQFLQMNRASSTTCADDSFIGETDNGIIIWGCQLEAGSGASSYIVTGASQVTRNADSCVMTGTNFSSWFAGATEGVLFTEYEKQRSQSGSASHDYAAVGSRYNTGEGFIVYHSNANFYPTIILWPTGGAVFASGIATAIPSVTKQAAKWFGGNDVTNYSNGVVGTTGVGTGTVTPAMLSFGANSTTGTEATRDWLNACIRRVKFYPTALSDAAIQTLTTP
jgi:hypothetical protein